jgi:cytosine/adenosine deaminase-related metal-dependent hydrolase
MNNTFWLENVKLETGYSLLENGAHKTETALFSIKVEDGNFREFQEQPFSIPSGEKKIDAAGLLALPTFKEMHNHLDKTYLSLDWKAPIPVKNLKERLHFEALELEELAPTTKQRASKMIEMILSKGSTHIRTHVNIDPYIGLKNLEGIKEALENYKDSLSCEIVAFPQHGMLQHEEVIPLMKEALRSGATIVGGLDPAGIDKNIEKSLYETMNLAKEFNADIDIHLHDHGHVGFYTIDKLVEMVEEAKWQDRAAVSHAFSLGDVPETQAKEMAQRLGKNGVAIMSTIPINRVIPPIDLLDKHNVPVYLGCDGFFDSWGPFGNGDVLEKVKRYCEKTKRIDEKTLAYSLKWAAGGKIPLSATGEMQWPKAGEEASFVLMEASCSAEAIARLPKRQAVYFKGKEVYRDTLSLQYN